MGTPRPTDRLPPGLGKVRWREVFQLLQEKHYPGYLRYEAPNPEYWSRPPEDVARSRRGDAETARGNRMTAWQLNRRDAERSGRIRTGKPGADQRQFSRAGETWYSAVTSRTTGG
jgi:hypothetical protein